MSINAAAHPVFDLDGAWALDPRVSVRSERFGALLYHFGTRRLSFLKSRTLLDLVRTLDQHPSARVACTECGIPDGELPSYRAALATLASSTTIIARPS